MNTRSPKVPIRVLVPEPVHRRLVAVADARGLTLSALVRRRLLDVLTTDTDDQEGPRP